MKEKNLENFFERINVIKKLSPDEDTKVGSVLVDPISLDTIASGYNGFIRGANDAKLPKSNPDKHEFIIHSEANLIYNAASQGIQTRGKIIICNLSPCIACYRALKQSGVAEIYFETFHKTFGKTFSAKDASFSIVKVGKYYKINIK